MQILTLPFFFMPDAMWACQSICLMICLIIPFCCIEYSAESIGGIICILYVANPSAATANSQMVWLTTFKAYLSFSWTVNFYMPFLSAILAFVPPPSSTLIDWERIGMDPDIQSVPICLLDYFCFSLLSHWVLEITVLPFIFLPLRVDGQLLLLPSVWLQSVFFDKPFSLRLKTRWSCIKNSFSRKSACYPCSYNTLNTGFYILTRSLVSPMKYSRFVYNVDFWIKMIVEVLKVLLKESSVWSGSMLKDSYICSALGPIHYRSALISTSRVFLSNLEAVQ